jgi:hypothetical protein
MFQAYATPVTEPRLGAEQAEAVCRPLHGTTLSITVRTAQPGDYLPPQAGLDDTAWADTGFRVGDRDGDVCLDLPDLPGKVLLFGPLGVLHTLADATTVTVVRPHSQ